jgi:hypothetical protein
MRDIEQIKEENERIVVQTLGLNYDEFFPQEHQCEN